MLSIFEGNSCRWSDKIYGNLNLGEKFCGILNGFIFKNLRVAEGDLDEVDSITHIC